MILALAAAAKSIKIAAGGKPDQNVENVGFAQLCLEGFRGKAPAHTIKIAAKLQKRAQYAPLLQRRKDYKNA